MIPLLGATTLTVTRYAAGSVVDGEWVDGAPSSLTVYGSVQPLTGRERQLLDEGTRATAKFKLHTEGQLRIVDPDNDTRGDIVTYDGRGYEVVTTERWADHTSGLPHFTYLLQELTLA